MIKNIASVFLMTALFSCSKGEKANNFSEETYVPAKYDTAAVDSFATGAISVDVAAEIRRSSVAYQDSVLKVKVDAEIAKKALEDKKKLEDLEKKKTDTKKNKVSEKAEPKKVE